MESATALKERAQVELKDTWDLTGLFEGIDGWEQAFKSLESDIAGLGELKGTFKNGSQDFLTALERIFAAELRMEQIYVYSHLLKDQDTAESANQALSERSASLAVALSSATSFLTPEILELSEQTISDYLAEQTGLEPYRHFLYDLLRSKNHVLSAEMEMLLSMSGEMGQSFKTVFSMLNNADIRFGTIKDAGGRDIELSHARFIDNMQSENREVRKAAFTTYYKSYEQLKNTYASLYAGSVKKDIFYTKARHYDNCLSAALHGDNVPLSVYDGLIEAVRANLPAMHRYMALRKSLLNVDELHMYDIYAPLVPQSDTVIPYEEARKMVMDAMAPLGEEYGAVLSRSMENRWIDVYENRGKNSGAYCWGAYGSHPYVLMNYQDNLHHVFTLAHELGHAMHTHFSDSAQPYPTAQYTIFCAEVASTVNETLLHYYLLERAQDEKQRKYLLNHYLEQFRTTLFRQVQFAEFEKDIHAFAEQGGAITADELCSRYRQLNADYYGETMTIDKEIEMEWARISHFYSSFYVYKYATGFASAIVLANGILKKQPGALEKYLGFLKSGGSDYPIELLKDAGVDLSRPDTVANGLKAFENTLEDFNNTY